MSEFVLKPFGIGMEKQAKFGGSGGVG